jgi:hypothetical protein
VASGTRPIIGTFDTAQSGHALAACRVSYPDRNEKSLYAQEHKTASNYLVSNANVSIGDVEPMLLDVVQTLSRVNARGRFVPTQFH